MTRHSRFRVLLWIWIAVLAVLPVQRMADGQTPEWMPTAGTHAWSRFGPRAWKEVRVRTYTVDANGQVLCSSTTIARTSVTRVERQSFSLCVSSTVEVAGREIFTGPQTLTREVAPQVDSTESVGTDKLVIDGQEYGAEIIRFVTLAGTQSEENTIYFCKDATPQLLRRVSTRTDSEHPDERMETTVTVTELNKMADILGETKRTWSTTTVVRRHDKTVTTREVNCADVPGELVSQITEEHDAKGVLVSREELELIGYGFGRPRFFRRR